MSRILVFAVFVVGALGASALLAAGCGSPTLTCDPACPMGSHCEATGCVLDNPYANPDLSTPQVDAGGACNPACSGATPFCNANKMCVPCLQDNQCPVGQICKSVGASASCVPGCADDTRCANGSKCCGGQCVDVSKDALNCGSCGSVCGSQHSSAVCSGGACMAGTCNPGWGDCDGDPKNGCEANLHTDPKNCTACKMACSFPNAINGCADGCFIQACSFGFDDCDGDPKNGCEMAVSTDPKNCGACGNACGAPAHATVKCVNAACQLTSCVVGYSDCNGDPKDGCEVATGTDAANCGTCGNKCAQGLVCINSACTCQQCNIPNSKTRCVNNQCVWDSCVAGFADCNNNTGDGCEVNLSSDANNCGSCKTVCPKNTPSCGSGQCVVGFDFGPMHSWTGLTATHYITQGCCSVNINGGQCNGTIDQNAQYFCDHFYGTPMGLTCTATKGYVVNTLQNCADVKMHKNGGCTGNGNNIPNTTCDTGACKIGNWSECTTGIANLVCHCQ